MGGSHYIMVILGPFMLHKPMKVTVVTGVSATVICMYLTVLLQYWTAYACSSNFKWGMGLALEKRDVELRKVLSRDKNSWRVIVMSFKSSLGLGF